MKTQVELDACAGKTIQGVAGLFQYRIITFIDGTFTHFCASSYDSDVSIEDEQYTIGNSDVSHEDCIRVGLYTADELGTMLSVREANWKHRREQQERQQYEQLKAKFEPTTPDGGTEA